MKKNQFAALAMAAAVLVAGTPVSVGAGQTAAVTSAPRSVAVENITQVEKDRFLSNDYRVEYGRLEGMEPKLYLEFEWQCNNFLQNALDAQRDGGTSQWWAFDVDIGENLFTEEQLDKVVKAFIADNPQYFWLNGEMASISGKKPGGSGAAYSGFKAGVFEQYASGKDRDSKFCELIASYENLYAINMGDNATDYEIVKELYDRMTENLTYSEDSALSDTIVGCLKEGKASSVGMARFFQFAMNRNGIDSRYLWADGADRGWNSVKMPDGNYYGIDVLAGVQAKASAADRYGIFLAGKTTVSSVTGKTFSEEHPLSAGQTGTDAYPELSQNAYSAPFQSITMEKTELTVKAGRRGKITLNKTGDEKKGVITFAFTPAAPSNLAGVTYESSDPTVMSVDERTGSWDALHSGTAEIKVKVTDASGVTHESDACVVTVEGEVISSDSVTTEQLEDFLNHGSRVEYTVLGDAENGELRQHIYDLMMEKCREFTLSKRDAAVLATAHSSAYSMEIMFEGDPVPLNDIWAAIHAFLNDNPHFFWVNKGMRFLYDDNEDDLSRCKGFMPSMYPEYQNGEVRYEKFRQMVARFHAMYTSKIGPNDTDYDIVKKIYSAIIDEVEYNYDLDASMTDSISGCLDTREAVCEGFARITCLCLNYYDIECRYVGSYNHAWNYAKMPNGRYYGLESTWGRNAVDYGGESLRYCYLLVGDYTTSPLNGKAFVITHPLDPDKQEAKENGSLLYPHLDPDAYRAALGSIRMEKEALSFYAGDEGRITYNRKGDVGADVISYMFSPAAPTDIESVTYMSSNPSVLQVDAQTGEWKALKEGTATVTVEAVNTSDRTFKSTECTVTVGKGGDKPVPVIKTGDVNNDGKVDLLDLRLVLRHVCSKITLDENQFTAADVNKDSKVDLLDLRLVLRYICGKIKDF